MSRSTLVLIGMMLAPVLPLRVAHAQSVGRASAAALASARSKENSMREPGGPQSVTLSADEMASLVEANLDRGARKALDSITIRLDYGRLTLQARLVTAELGSEYLGPMIYMLEEREPLAVAGPATAARAGLLTWAPDSLVIKSFPLPLAMIPKLVNRLTGTTDGTIPIAVPPTVRYIRIAPSGVTFSRTAD